MMKSEAVKKIATAVSLLAALTLLCSCPNLFNSGPFDPEDTLEIETGVLLLSLESNFGVRPMTVLPSPFPTIGEYTILFDSGPEPKDPVVIDSETTSITLALGTWDISVEGRETPGSDVIAKGSKTGIVIAPGENPQTITITPTQTGTGTVDITVDWSDTVTVGNIEATFNIFDTADQAAAFVFDGSSAILSGDYPSGDYQLVVMLEDNETDKNILATVYEIIKVYDNIATVDVLPVADTSFHSAPEAPDLVTVSAVSESEILVQWADNSVVELGYIVERKEEGGDYEQIADVDYSTYTLNDTLLQSNTTYYYHVYAYNNFGNSTYSNESSDKTDPVPGDVLWTFTAGGAIASTPAIDPLSGYVVFGSDDGNVYALDPTDGSEQWSYPTGGSVSSSPAVSTTGTVFVGSADTYVYALGGGNGSEIWPERCINGAVESSPAIGIGDRLYIGSNDNEIYSLNTATGSIGGSYATGASVVSSPAVGIDGEVYVGSTDNSVYCFDEALEYRWDYATGGEVISHPAIGEDGVIYVGSKDSKVYAFYPSGVMRWERLTGNEIHGGPAIASDGTIFVGSADGKLYRLNPVDGEDAAAPFVAGSPVYSTPAVDDLGFVYFGAANGWVFAVDSATGTEVWSYDTGSAVYGSGLIDSTGVLCVGSSDHNLYAFHTGASGPAPSPWPMLHRDPLHSGYNDSIGDAINPWIGGSGALTFENIDTTTLTVNWTKSTDNRNLQSELQYKVVMSTEGDISTIPEADISGSSGNKTLLQDWTADIATFDVTGLSEGTQYYFNVLVKDASDNKAIYEMADETTLGSLGLTIVFDEPGDETITMDQDPDQHFTPVDLITVAISEPFTSYKWTLDGDDFADTDNSVTVDCFELYQGVHQLTAFVQDVKGSWYSKSLRFYVDSTDAWSCESVYTEYGAGLFNSITTDTNGFAHISYYVGMPPNRGLKYAHWDGSSWHTASVVDGEFAGLGTSIAIDSSDNPVIAFHDGEEPPHQVKYARWIGTSWQIETVDDSLNRIDYSVSLVLDESDQAHISYGDDYSGLKYARWNGSSWGLATVDSGNVGYFSSLALDSNEYPHIAYGDGSNGGGRYARFDGTVWHIEVVDNGGGLYASLALDTNDYAHIVHSGFEYDFVKYSSWNGISWQSIILESSEIYSGPSIVLNDDLPVVFYYEIIGSDACLKNAVVMGSEAVIQVVDPDMISGGNPAYFENTSASVDAFGRIHVSYVDQPFGDYEYTTTTLKHARSWH